MVLVFDFGHKFFRFHSIFLGGLCCRCMILNHGYVVVRGAAPYENTECNCVGSILCTRDLPAKDRLTIAGYVAGA